MFGRDFHRAIRMMHEDMERAMEQRHTPFGKENYDGYRREVVNGEETEYVLEDGEWVELGKLEQQTLDFELSQLDDTTELTMDIPSQLPTLEGMEAEASINNGVLNISFKH